MSAWRSICRGTAWALRILRTPFSKYVPIEQDFVAYRAEREAHGKTRPVQIRKAG